ncbi:hypothetical protein ACFWAR_34265 [Streptomyces sp. NPDC059917]|uniref:hypothetical protein n=1 Tax=Streptomyces sp. NPDC059917 TaxID=3347002 RepID=UPI00364A6EFB
MRSTVLRKLAAGLLGAAGIVGVAGVGVTEDIAPHSRATEGSVVVVVAAPPLPCPEDDQWGSICH